jgi:hypothetical protein
VGKGLGKGVEVILSFPRDSIQGLKNALPFYLLGWCVQFLDKVLNRAVTGSINELSGEIGSMQGWKEKLMKYAVLTPNETRRSLWERMVFSSTHFKSVKVIHPARDSHPLIWMWMAILLWVMCCLQAAYIFRRQAVAYWPVLQPAYEIVCQRIGCAVPVLQRPSSILIASSALQVSEPLVPDEAFLNVRLKNQAAVALAYPGLALELTDSLHYPLARRVFQPREYLNAGIVQRRYFAAQGEVSLKIPINLTDVPAAGFRLTLVEVPEDENLTLEKM